MNKDQIINTLKVITLALVLSVGIQYAAADSVTSWVPPSLGPPSGNTYAPLNVGSSGQVKDGGLTLGYALTGASAGLIVPNAISLFGTTNIPGNLAKISVGNVETDTSGFNPLMTFESLGSTPAAYYHNLRLGTDHSLNIDSWNNTWGYTMSIKPNHQVVFGGSVRIPTGGATGKVLTSDSTGVGTWQTGYEIQSRTFSPEITAAGTANVVVNSDTVSARRVCGLTANKKYVAQVYGTNYDGSQSDGGAGYDIVIQVRGSSLVSGTITVNNHPDGSAPLNMPIVVNANASGCVGLESVQWASIDGMVVSG